LTNPLLSFFFTSPAPEAPSGIRPEGQEVGRMETLTKNEKNEKIEVVRGTPHFVAETEEALSRLRELPLPVQIVLRALQHFTDKANDGADVQVHYKETEAFFRVSTRKSTLLFERLPASRRYQLYFERHVAGALIVKKVTLECNEEIAMKFARALREAFLVALVEGIVDVRRVLEFFTS